MKSKITRTTLVFTALASLLCIMFCITCNASRSLPAPQTDASGNYLIANTDDLFSFAEIVNNGDTDANAILLCDININPGTTVTEVAPSVVWTPIASFAGTFDGKGHTIYGLYVNSTNSISGLFSSNSGVIKNLSIDNSYITGTSHIGAICGNNSGTITNCTSYAYVDGNKSASRIGGICGYNTKIVSQSINSGTVVSINTNEINMGGIVGYNEKTIQDCLNIGSVSGVSGNAGGICGRADFPSNIVRCINTAEIYSDAQTMSLGSICGNNQSTIKNCYFLSGYISGIGAGTKSGTTSCDSFESGEIAYNLNNLSSASIWGQKIGTEQYPSPGNTNVIYMRNKYADCTNTSSYTAIYTNTDTDIFGAHIDADADKLCDNCKVEFDKLLGTSISLGTDISVNCYAVLSNTVTSPKVTFTINGNTYTSNGVVDGNRYIFTLSNIAPQCLGDNIHSVLYDDTTVLDTQEKYSIKAYCEELLKHDADYYDYTTEKYNAMRTLIYDLLVYGGAAQEYIGHNIDALVSDNIKGSSYNMPTKNDLAVNTNGTYVTFTGASMLFNNANHLVFRFTATDVSNMKLKISKDGGNETEIEFEQIANNLYIATLPAMYATEFDTFYTLTAYSDETKGASITYNVASYVYAMQSSENTKMAALAKAVYYYGISAQAFASAV